MVSITADDVRSALDADGTDDYAFEIKQAEQLVNDEVVPYTDASDERLELVATLLAAAFADDDGTGPVRSVESGSGSITYAPEAGRALTFWKRALQMDPSGRLADIDKPVASIVVPDAR